MISDNSFRSNKEKEPIAVLTIIKKKITKDEKDGAKDCYIATVPYMDLDQPQIFCPNKDTFTANDIVEEITEEIEDIKNNLFASRGRESGQDIVVDPAPYERIKHIGKRIFNNLGLYDVFTFLFNHGLEDQNIILLTDEHDFPWEWAYSEEQDKFLCEYRFGKLFPEDAANTLDRFEHNKNKKKPNKYDDRMEYLNRKNIIIWGHNCKSDNDKQYHLEWIDEEIEAIESIMIKKMKDPIKICNKNKRLEYEASIRENMAICKILHFSGHIVDGKMKVGTNYIDVEWLTNQGFDFDSHPLVFLNGCSSGNITDVWNKTKDLAISFFKLGASACVVTNMPVSDLVAKEFSSVFYDLLVSKDFSYGFALQQARKIIKNKFKGKDPSWLFYTLYGDPRQKLVPDVGTRQRSVEGFKDVRQDATNKEKNVLNYSKKTRMNEDNVSIEQDDIKKENKNKFKARQKLQDRLKDVKREMKKVLNEDE